MPSGESLTRYTQEEREGEHVQLRRSLLVRETPHLDVSAAAADKQGVIFADVHAMDATSMGFSKRERAHAIVPVPHLESPANIATYNECVCMYACMYACNAYNECGVA